LAVADDPVLVAVVALVAAADLVAVALVVAALAGVVALVAAVEVGVDADKWLSVLTDLEAQAHANGNHGPMVRIRRTGATESVLVRTGEFPLKKGSDQLRELEAVLVRYVEPVLQEADIQKLVKTLHESAEFTTEPTTGNTSADREPNRENE
jgi:hypothetical protein